MDYRYRKHSGTAADVRGTAQETEFFNNDDACTVLQSRNCTGKSRSAATDNNNVGIVFDRRFICGRERFIEFVALCAGLFQTLFHSAEKRETGNSGAADFVEFGCLMIFDFGRSCLIATLPTPGLSKSLTEMSLIFPFLMSTVIVNGALCPVTVVV